MIKRKTTEQFIKEAKLKHGDKYDYSLVEYTSNNSKVKIICKEHGVFEQIAKDHIIRGSICRKCSLIKRGKSRITNHLKTKINNITQPDNYKLIPLTKGKFAKVDNEDYNKVICISWKLTSGKYASNTKIGLMHRFIMNCPDDMVIDHINHDTFDNRKGNLRICTTQENVFNNRPFNNSSSQYKGVSFFYRTKTWVSKIYYNSKTKNLGYYRTELEAAKAYDAKAKELFGEFAYLNFK